jgi:hypothetical protein
LKSKDTGSIEKLRREVKILWTTDLSKEYLKSLMPRRIRQVLAVKGDNIGY